MKPQALLIFCFVFLTTPAFAEKEEISIEKYGLQVR